MSVNFSYAGIKYICLSAVNVSSIDTISLTFLSLPAYAFFPNSLENCSDVNPSTTVPPIKYFVSGFVLFILSIMFLATGIYGAPVSPMPTISDPIFAGLMFSSYMLTSTLASISFAATVKSAVGIYICPVYSFPSNFGAQLCLGFMRSICAMLSPFYFVSERLRTCAWDSCDARI